MVTVPPNAMIVAFVFLGAALLTAAGSAGALFGVLSKRYRFAVGSAVVAAAVGGAYTLVWAGGIVSMPERVLAPGEAKYFCEIDCHLAYSIARVERMTSLGAGAPPPSSGSFLVVTVKTWFDPSTISPRRPLDVALRPNPRDVFLRTGDGTRYRPLSSGAAALAAAGRANTPMTEPLRPGESYETILVFDTPSGASEPRLFVGTSPAESAFLIGHESAPFARRAWFSLR